MPIVDPGVGVKQTASLPYSEGVKNDIFMRSPSDGKYYLGKVWPGWVHFVDFLHPNAHEYWKNMLEKFKTNLPYDGLWLDMNEISNFCGTYSDCNRENSNHTDVDIKEEYINSEVELTYWPGRGNIRNFTIRK